jgi:O-antigen/teichoic acid export membrane protein
MGAEQGSGSGGAAPGAAERHVARGALVQQVAQVFGTLVMLGVITLLGRRLTLSEFGVYGLLISIASYVLIVQLSVEAAAVRAISSRTAARERAVVYGTAFVCYAVLGVAAGALVAGGGSALVAVLDIREDLEREATTGVLALGLVTALGWPLKVFQDGLRADQLFGRSALGEMAGYATMGALMVAVVVLDAQLWVLIVVGGSLSALIGLWCALIASARALPWPRPRDADAREARAMLAVAWQLFLAGITDIVIYSLDRVILAAYRSTAAVGLYEGAVRPHNLVRQLHGSLTLTVVPVASGYLAAEDEFRVRELLLRGTRYVVAIVAPATVVLMVLSAPVLEVWLGERFRVAAPALAILTSYWLVGANTGVSGAMLIAAGRVSVLAWYSWLVAAVNLALALLLTPMLGLEGVALAIAAPYVFLFPIFFRFVLKAFPSASLRDFAREAWVPTYSLCAALAVVLAACRLLLDLDTLVEVGAVAVTSLGLYSLAWLAIFATPGERALVRAFIRR